MPFPLRGQAAWVKEKAIASGFDLVGIAPARQFAEHLILKRWVADGKHGDMTWMERTLEKRLDPLKVMPSARSVIMCGVNYNTDYPRSTEHNSPQPPLTLRGGEPRGWIARYAWGDDYHEVLKHRCERFAAFFHEQFPSQLCRYFIDTGPILERIFAKYAGIGWIGKNTCLINSNVGSWFFLVAMVTDLELEADGVETDHCGTCTRCIDACPTSALEKPYHLDARKCISYLTIEHRGPIDPELISKMSNHIFGCDICQDVCPWNRKALTTDEPAFQPREGFFAPSLESFRKKVEEDYPQAFKGSPLKRAKQEGLLRNIAIAESNVKRK